MAALPAAHVTDEAKFSPARIRHASVEKVDLIARLATCSTPFAAIVAPAGYGKSTLMAQWTAADPRPAAWVQLDERDDDSRVFLRDVAGAVGRVRPISTHVFDALSGPGETIWARVPYLGNAIAELKEPFVLVLDDLHAVTNLMCLNVLAALVDYVPPGSQIVITSRTIPALPLARWRVQGALLEIGVSDLRLDVDEADALLKGASVTLEASEVADLTERTEGWPAGLYLAALALRAAPGSPTLDRFSGADRYVADYFRLEVLSRLDQSEATFLIRTSLLDRMSGPLCDAVLETTGSSSVLGSIERGNRFVTALDHQSAWFRYHHLFRQLLRDELTRTVDDATLRGLNRRAMEWWLAIGELEVAAQYGHAAGELEVVADIIDRLAWPLFYDGRMETLEEYLGWFSDTDLRRFPMLAVHAAWARTVTGRATEAERYLSIAQAAVSDTTADVILSVRGWVFQMRAMMMPDGPERMIVDADDALERFASSDAGKSSALILRGVGHALAGSPELARADLRASIDCAEAAGGLDDIFIAQGMLALLEANRRSWTKAAGYARAARERAREARLDRYSFSAIVHVAVARVALHEGRPAEARAAIARAHRIRPMLDHGVPWLTVQVGIELARVHLALGETEAARAVLGDNARVIIRRPDLGSLIQDQQELADRVAEASGAATGWAVNLTAAELRLLPFLATHLTFPEIAGRLFVTSHTVRSQAKAVYGKLDASSRSQAVDRAVDVGLLEPMFPHRENVAS